MADKAISELIAANQVTPTDMFVLEQSGTAKKLTGQILENWLVSIADGHGGIQSIQKVSTSGLTDTYRITLADTTTFDFVVTNGKSVENIHKTGTSGLVDTYTIYYTGGLTSTFTVTNGAKGDKGDNQYVWIKYASQQPTAISHSFGDVPDNWIGIYSGSSATAPTDWQQYKWFQIKGEKGDTGAAATLTSFKVEYQVSASGTIIPSGAWSASVPVVAQGKYLWTRTTNTFNTGAPVVAYSVSRMGVDGSGSVSSVANISPDANGNVPLTAEHIGAVPSAGGEMTGELNMNGQPISGLNAPTANDHAANMDYVNAQVRKAAPRNLLDNSDFRNPVNQRGQTLYTEMGYTIDRWKLENRGDNGISVSSTGIALNETTTTLVFQQSLTDELKNRLIGKNVTLAVTDADNNIYVATNIVPKLESSMSVVAVAIAPDLTSAVYYSGSSKQLRVRFIASKMTSSITIANVALYEGEYTAETLPEYQSKGYGAELVECQRYFYKITDATGTGLMYTNSGDVSLCIPYPATMRTTPTVTVLRAHVWLATNGESVVSYKDLQVSNVDTNEQNLRRVVISNTGDFIELGAVATVSMENFSFEASADL